MVYKFSYRATWYNVPAQQAGEHLRALKEKHGELDKYILLEDSRAEDALLHNCFEWDDTKAAEGFRLNQAQSFITNITCVIVDDEGKETEPVRAFVNVADQSHAQRGSFVAIMDAMSDEKHRAIVLKNALGELVAFQNKYSQLTELAKVFEAIEDTIKESEVK